ncbi:MAG: undecaprenyl/decaprenyl-phosphate alpha-N-acetylglucosaminyl 1-phosphate transferase [Anaerolineae bacterium]|nr:undecaprenyl/decaprenyl-phosphate alpha-N-acetylglucosaminyl 1-phosphate transferase [Anaerolineae bacterium]
MTRHLPVLIVGFVCALALTPLSRFVALRTGLVAQPREQRLHRKATPLMGGLAIYGALVLALLVFGLPAHFMELGAILAGATMMTLLGLWDDRKELSPRAKFAGQVVASVVLVLAGVQVRLFNVPLLDWGLTVAWILGVTNAINYQDNMDGLAAGVSAIASGFFLLLAVMEGQDLVGSLAAALCGASVGFLVYNFNPANTFMGDMGSMVLGFTLAVLGIKLRFDGQPLNVTWMIPVLVLGLPLFDMALVTFTRLREGRSPFVGSSRDHTSHRFLRMGLSQRVVLAILYAVCVGLGAAGVAVSRAPSLGWIIGGGAAVLALGAFVFLEWVYARNQP